MRKFLAVLTLLALTAGCRGEPDVPSSLEERETPPTLITSGRSGEDKDPEVSPDGATLLYASSSFGDSLDLYAKTIGSNTATRILSLPGDERFPKINPVNPRTLAFCSNSRQGVWEICLMEDYVDKPGKFAVVSESGAHSIHPSWSPDGRKLVYCALDESGDGDWVLKVKDFTTGRTHTFQDIDGLLPEWSPAGNRIVFQRMKHRDGWYGGLWTVEFSGGEARSLTSLFSSDEWAAINPSWSPDGTRVVFATVGKSRERTGMLHEGDDLWMVGDDGSHPTRLTTSPAADGMPVVSRDGKIYFVSRRTGSDRIWSLTLAGARP